MKLRHAALALLTLAAFSAEGRAQTIDSLLTSGFKQVSAMSVESLPVPAAKMIGSAAAPSERGVYLHSRSEGTLYFCSADGCRELAAKGSIGVAVVSGKGGLYYSSQNGTGYCSPKRCDLLLPGVWTTFALTAGPNGDIWATDRLAAYHCTPGACRKALEGGIQSSGNYLNGVYKANGDFIASGDMGTFWCTGDSCRLIGGGEILFIEERCAGAAPAHVSYGFWGRAILRCEPTGCRTINGNDDEADSYAVCSFDAKGRVHLPLRGAAGSLACGTTCERDASAVVAKAEKASRTSDSAALGSDGASYALVDRSGEPAPAQGAPSRLTPVVRRTDARGSSDLLLEAPVKCWQWVLSDDDEISEGWRSECGLLPASAN